LRPAMATIRKDQFHEICPHPLQNVPRSGGQGAGGETTGLATGMSENPRPSRQHRNSHGPASSRSEQSVLGPGGRTNLLFTMSG